MNATVEKEIARIKRVARRYRKKRSAKVYWLNSWNWDIEAGDLLVGCDGKLFRAEVSSGWGKRNSGELYQREIHPPKNGMKATILDGEIYWVEPQLLGNKQ